MPVPMLKAFAAVDLRELEQKRCSIMNTFCTVIKPLLHNKIITHPKPAILFVDFLPGLLLKPAMPGNQQYKNKYHLTRRYITATKQD